MCRPFHSALGPWVIEELLARGEFPEEGSVLDVGTPGLDLTPYLAGADTVLLVDTVKGDPPAGRMRVYSREELLTRPPQPRFSPHDPGLTDALFTLSFAGCAPRDVVLVGVVPDVVAKGIGLSGSVQQAVPVAAAEVVRRLTALGFLPRPKASAKAACPWWEQAVAT